MEGRSRRAAFGLSDWVAIYRGHFAITFSVQLQYRAALAIWLIGLVLTPLVSLVVWTTVASSAGGQAGGYSGGAFAAYFLALLVTNHLTFTWIAWEFEFQVRNGTLSGLLLRPVDPIHAYVADNLTYKVITMSVVAPAVVVLAVAFRPEADVTPASFGLYLVAVALAMVLRFLAEYTLALAAFWTTRIFAINDLYYVPLFFFSGQMVPLALLPDWVQAIGAALPFRWMLSFPVEVAIGRVSGADAVAGLAAQAAWIVAFALVREGTWRLGLRRYGAVGA